MRNGHLHQIFLYFYRFAGPEAVTDVALEDDSVALGEAEGLVSALQGRSVRHEAREDGRIRWTALFISN